MWEINISRTAGNVLRGTFSAVLDIFDGYKYIIQVTEMHVYLAPES